MASFLRPNVAGNWPGEASLSRIADACALATAAVGLLVMVGWLLGIEPLKRVLPGLVAMKFNTALAFVVAGAALWWRQRPALRLGLGALVATFGALALGEYLSGRDWGIDQLFFREVPAAPAAAFPPGRMAPATSVCFLLCGLALMCSRGSKRGPRPGSTPAVEAGLGRGFVVDVLAFGAAAIAGFALIGYATGTESLRHLPGFISMALNTAAAFVLLAAGILCAVPGGSDRAGRAFAGHGPHAVARLWPAHHPAGDAGRRGRRSISSPSARRSDPVPLLRSRAAPRRANWRSTSSITPWTCGRPWPATPSARSG